ncbi:MAG: ABC transporter ATP-binding protein [Gemmatimonadetes bacterium]|nr:ABC transporter ATP-binding protein [Gemmatimonadota bacterium]
MLVASDLTVRYREAPSRALEGVDLAVSAGEVLCLVGPNGSGKTTLARALLGLVGAERGQVVLDGRPVKAWRAAERAKRIGILPQREELPFSWRVDEVVGFGRYAWMPPLASLGRRDREIIERSMERADVLTLAQRRVDTLSGGEWQRVRIARALAQEPAVLVLDEPTAALDLGHEMEIFELIRTLVRDGLATVVVTHQLNLAARFADRMILLERGRVAAAGPPMEVMEAALLERVFGWPVIISTLADGTPQFSPERGTAGRPRTLPPEAAR